MLVATKASHTWALACLPANVLRSRAQHKPLSVGPESKFPRKMVLFVQPERAVSPYFSLSGIDQGTASCNSSMVSTSGCQGKEFVSREDSSKMPITFILDLL